MLDSCRSLQRDGMEVTYLPVGKDGLVDLKVTFPPSFPPPPRVFRPATLVLKSASSILLFTGALSPVPLGVRGCYSSRYDPGVGDVRQ